MVSIKRSDFYLFSRLTNRVFGKRHNIDHVNFTPCTGGAELTMANESVAVRMHIAGQVQEKWTIPWNLIKETAGLTDGMVELTHRLTQEKRGNVMESYHDVTADYKVNGIPKQGTYRVPDRPDEVLPAIPGQLAEQTEAFFDCLIDAGRYVETDSARYALGMIALNGNNGTMSATDGRMLIQFTGWTFPWDDVALIPASPITLKEFRELGKPTVGYQDQWATVKCGNCMVQFKCPGRFPVVENIIPHETGMAAWITLSEKDAGFLLKAIDDLPFFHKDRNIKPITIEVKDDTAFIRGADSDGTAVELMLTESVCHGTSAVVVIDREFIKRLLKSGCTKIGLTKENPILTLGENRLVVAMPLSETLAVLHSDGMTTVSSSDFAATDFKPALKQRSKPKVSRVAATPTAEVLAPALETAPTAKAIAPAFGTVAQAIPKSKTAQSDDSTDDLIQIAELFRNAIREANAHANRILKIAKADAKKMRAIKSRDILHERALKSTLNTLKLFQNTEA